MLHETQANRLFSLLEEQGYSITDFVLEQQRADDGPATLLKHQPSGYYFKLRDGTIKQLSGQELPAVYPSYTPDTTSVPFNPNKEKRKDPTGKWLLVLSIFNEWLTILKKEGATPNL